MKIRLSLVLALAVLFAAAWGAALFINIKSYDASRGSAPAAAAAKEETR